jgi:FKBP-type peptidyl-prolyl cis-trans isomerase FkpA/FKBP-type peptidyl-prolyl cis-trans isomerase FklB
LRTVTYHSTDQSIGESGTRVVQFSIISDSDFAVTRPVTVTPRTDAQRTESVAVRDERLIQEYLAAEGLTSETTDSGLHYIVETEGNGELPTATDDIVATYRGTYLNGVKFDNGTDVPFNLSRVIEGWTEGFQFFSPGGTGKLLIPSALAYGANGTNSGAGIPPNSVLLFDVEFVSNETQDLANNS